MEPWEAAYEDYKAGLKYKEIAKKYGVSESAVKSWASRKWKKKTQKRGATPKNKKSQPTGVAEPSRQKGPGAPMGNQNAKGNRGGKGGPFRNQKHLKHGAYCQVFGDLLSEEEKEILNKTDFSKIAAVSEEIALLTIRERRLMREIEKYQTAPTGLAVHHVTKDKDGTSTTAVNIIEYTRILNTELSRVQRVKANYMKMLLDLGEPPEQDNSLLQAIEGSAREVWNDVPGIQSEADEGDDLVGAPGDQQEV